MNSKTVLLATSVAIATVIAACYVGPLEDANKSSASPTDPRGDASAPGAQAGSTGMPCDVEQVFLKNCSSCHTAPLSAPISLASYDDLVAESKKHPGQKVAEVAVARMKSTTDPMPPDPAPHVGADAVAVVEKWIADGYPKGSCGASGNDGGPTEIQSVCTSGKTWTFGDDEDQGSRMNPGKACIACHLEKQGKAKIALGGTVYPTVREPDLCYGAAGSGAVVVITDASGREYRLDVGPTGNFAIRSGAIETPYSAKVVVGTNVREMKKKQTSTDCNSCHTETGENGAPGRIMLP